MTQDQRRIGAPIPERTALAGATQAAPTAEDVLAMPAAELLDLLRHESAANPALEVVEPPRRPARRRAPPLPDVIIARESGTASQRGFVVEIAASTRLAVRVRPEWLRRHLAASDLRVALAEDERRSVQECVARARHLIAHVHQRRQTLTRLAWCLIDLHWDALQRGDGGLPVMARAPVAFRAGMHEATLTHAIAGKWIQLPTGAPVPLRQLFQTDQRITTAILELIHHEARPLTDADLARALRRRAITVDERTVAAYRGQLGLPSAPLRVPAVMDAGQRPARRRAPPAGDRMTPSVRAQQLLRAVLSQQEREQLSSTGFLYVLSPSHPHRLYRIPDYLGRVRMFEQGQAVCDLCVVPSEALPPADVIVMHKLMIQGDEEAYLRSANRFPVYSFAATDLYAQNVRP